MKNPFEISLPRYVQRRAKEEGVGNIVEKYTAKKEYADIVHFSYEFRNGGLLEIIENAEGGISIILKTRDGRQVDLKSYVPAGYNSKGNICDSS